MHVEAHTFAMITLSKERFKYIWVYSGVVKRFMNMEERWVCRFIKCYGFVHLAGLVYQGPREMRGSTQVQVQRIDPLLLDADWVIFFVGFWGFCDIFY